MKLLKYLIVNFNANKMLKKVYLAIEVVITEL